MELMLEIGEYKCKNLLAVPEGVALAQPEAAAFIQAQAHAVGAVVGAERMAGAGGVQHMPDDNLAALPLGENRGGGGGGLEAEGGAAAAEGGVGGDGAGRVGEVGWDAAGAGEREMGAAAAAMEAIHLDANRETERDYQQNRLQRDRQGQVFSLW